MLIIINDILRLKRVNNKIYKSRKNLKIEIQQTLAQEVSQTKTNNEKGTKGHKR